LDEQAFDTNASTTAAKVERVVLNALAKQDGFAAGYPRLRRFTTIVFGAATDAKQRPGFPPDPPKEKAPGGFLLPGAGFSGGELLSGVTLC